jgi:hypothetical protein
LVPAGLASEVEVFMKLAMDLVGITSAVFCEEIRAFTGLAEHAAQEQVRSAVDG